ncbi:FadR/GntR family transcriptional regulator [Methyloraptor flagellatus]|uniref:FadR/GntR family transcriptional regulator n=1 Tax=Methyloraptor flagellatus TaxID=3162530 RepID=A0AAU7X6L7_9HYPH
MPFQAIETQRLYQQVAQQVAGLIHGGELGPGERLPPERDLARRLGVSRPTVREAMIALEIAGLVEVRVGSGIYVRQPNGADGAAPSFDEGPSPYEIVDARLMIEPLIAADAARNATAADDAAIASTLAELEAAGTRELREAADRRFHTLIARAAGNSVMVTFVESLWAGMSSTLFAALADRTGLPEIRAITLADHRAIATGIRARDPGEAAEAMRAHLAQVRKVLDTTADPPAGSAATRR